MDLLTKILEIISQFILGFIENTGYLGIFILSALESAAIPIPSEIVIPFSGFLVAQGKFSLLGITIIATLANLTGSIILYWIGSSGGRWLIERYGKYFLIRSHDLQVGEEWFSRYGTWAVFWSRMLPVVRTFISLPAGVARMNFFSFCWYTTLGALPWNFGLALVGYKLGENWNLIYEQYLHEINYLVAGLVVAAVIWYFYRRWSYKGVL